MRFLFLALALAPVLALPAPALAAWSHEKGPDWVVTQTSGNGVLIDFRCSRRFPNQVRMTLTGRSFPDVPGVMIWMTLPDGRMARHSVDTRREDGALIGTFAVSSTVMEEFRTGTRMEIDMPTRQGEDIAVVDMVGTGAARLAMQERCGF